ncbi:MAG: uridylate kinase [Ardenticatenales bacterium]|nr:uridylate kinase [Ardenticatenales bacterium]
MDNLVFIKLGGSLITDKQQRYHARAETIQRLAMEIARARAADPSLRILLGHGSGSFGHVAAKESGYDPKAGHPSPLAFAQVGAAASALNHLVRAALLEAGVPALSLPPSASARLEQGRVIEMALHPFASLLEQGIVPLVYGDVALHEDGIGGAIASTEAVFRYLASALRPQRLLLLGIVEGVLERAPTHRDPAPSLLHEIGPSNWERVRAGLGGSHGTDVTGGMVAKVAETLALVQTVPTLQARIVSGEQAGLLEQLLLEPSLEAGTLIHNG